MFSLNAYIDSVEKTTPAKLSGRVDEVVGFLIKAYNPGLSIGSSCKIENEDNLLSFKYTKRIKKAPAFQE